MAGTQYSFISKNQLDTIRSKVTSERVDHNTEDRRRLKELSDERASKWPNTLEAQRARKERARLERMAAEESERIEADRAEAEMRAEDRRIQIERANKILFDETDKVKGFHGKMLHCDALHENQALIGFKKQIDVLKKAQEAAFVEQQRQALELAEAAELAKMEETRRRALAQKAAQTQQLEELKTRILEERAENKKEGQMIRSRAEQEAEEARLKALERLAKNKQFNSEVAEANQILKVVKQKETARDKAQDAAIEAYSRRRAELQAQREAKEAEKRAKGEADRKAIADMMQASYLNYHNKEEERLTRDLAAADAKSAAEEAARRKRQQELKTATHKSNQQQLRNKAEARAAELHEGQQYAAEWKDRMKQLKEEEEAERRARFEEARKLQGYQHHQVDRKNMRAATQKLEDLHDAAQIQLSLKEQDELYKQYADECISEYKSQGKPTLPMELHLNKRPGLQLYI